MSTYAIYMLELEGRGIGRQLEVERRRGEEGRKIELTHHLGHFAKRERSNISSMIRQRTFFDTDILTSCRMRQERVPGVQGKSSSPSIVGFVLLRTNSSISKRRVRFRYRRSRFRKLDYIPALPSDGCDSWYRCGMRENEEDGEKEREGDPAEDWREEGTDVGELGEEGMVHPCKGAREGKTSEVPERDERKLRLMGC